MTTPIATSPNTLPELVPADELPRVENLITEDEKAVDNIFSERQQRLLVEALYSSWQPTANRPFLALANVGLFYAVRKAPLVPDVMVSLDVSPPAGDVWAKRNRSYFLWEYGKPPEVVIEIVSNQKGSEIDSKRRDYARVGVTHYVVFDPSSQLFANKVRYYELVRGSYVEQIDSWLAAIELGLTLWEGDYEGLHQEWLRWRTRDGKLILTGAERAEKLAAQLRALGVEPQSE